MGTVNVTQITQYTRTINFGRPGDPASLVSRATGPTQPPTVPGAPAPMPGCVQPKHHRTASRKQLGSSPEHHTDSVGFLEGGCRGQCHGSPAGRSAGGIVFACGLQVAIGPDVHCDGYINNQNLVTKVETHVDHAVVGDLLVEFEYSKLPGQDGRPGAVQHRSEAAGLTTFDGQRSIRRPQIRRI
jgi:hypothetical protein